MEQENFEGLLDERWDSDTEDWEFDEWSDFEPDDEAYEKLIDEIDDLHDAQWDKFYKEPKEELRKFRRNRP